MSNKLNMETSLYLSDITKIGWNFDNSYSRLPNIFVPILKKVDPNFIAKI